MSCDIKCPCDAIGTIVHLIAGGYIWSYSQARYYRLRGSMLCAPALYSAEFRLNYIHICYIQGLDNYFDPFSWVHIPPMIHIVTHF